MMAGAIEMLAAGMVLAVASGRPAKPRVKCHHGPVFCRCLSGDFGSLIAINAYMYLIRNVTPPSPPSYAYVDPVVAVLLGTGFAGEPFVHPSGWRWASLFCRGAGHAGKYLFPAELKLRLVRWRSKLWLANALRVDLRAVTAAADPLFQTLSQRLIAQLQSPAQLRSQTISARHPCSCKRMISRLSRATFFANFLQPERRARCGHF